MHYVIWTMYSCIKIAFAPVKSKNRSEFIVWQSDSCIKTVLLEYPQRKTKEIGARLKITSAAIARKMKRNAPNENYFDFYLEKIKLCPQIKYYKSNYCDIVGM